MSGKDNAAEPSASSDESISELITQRRFTEVQGKVASPKHVKLLCQLATAMLQAGEYPTAEKAFRTILVSSPDSWSAAYFLGVSFEKQGQLDNALASYELAATQNPSSTQAVSKIRALRQRINKELTLRSG